MQRRAEGYLVWSPLLPGAMVAATLIYSMTSVLAPDLIDEFGFSKARLGWLLSLFSILSAALSPLAGRITDRIGSRSAMLIIFASTGLGFIFFSWGFGFYSLVGAASVIAIGQALANPATNKLIAGEFDAGQRGLITGIKQSGVQFGALCSGAFFPAVALAYGWRQVPLFTGIAFLGLFVFALFVLPIGEPQVKNSHRKHSATAAELPPSVPLLAAYALLMGLGGSTLITFLPLYAVEQIGSTEVAAGILIAISGAFGMPARIGAAVIADRSGKPLPLLAILSGLAVGSTVAVLLANLGGYVLLIVAAALSGLGVSAWNSVAMLAVINDAGPEQSGRASGIVLSGFLTGLAISPPLFGYSVDVTGSYNLGFAVVGASFAVAAAVIIFAIRADR